jgi:hypothetical protein
VPLPLAQQTFPYTFTGILSPAAGQARYYNDTGRTLILTSIRAAVGTPPVGGPITVDVHRNGASIFTSPQAQPSIGDGQHTAWAGAAVPFAPGDYLTVDVDTVGTTTPGSDLTVTVVAQ